MRIRNKELRKKWHRKAQRVLELRKEAIAAAKKGGKAPAVKKEAAAPVAEKPKKAPAKKKAEAAPAE